MMTDRERNHEVTIIGIAGGTGSGKTTVVREIVEALPPNHVTVIPLDLYYNDTSEMTEEERHVINFDHPDAFDWKPLIKQMNELHEGGPIGQPIYSYLRCNRPPETIHVEPWLVAIIEGIMALLSKRLREMMNLKVLVGYDPDERFIRNTRRNIVERGQDVNTVVQRYLNVLKPVYEQFIKSTKRFADMIVPQGGENLKGINILCKYVECLVLINLSQPMNNAEACVEMVL